MLTVITSPETTNNNIVIVCHLVATSPTATWHLPSCVMWMLVHLETWHCHVVIAVMVVGDGCAWQRLVVGMVRWASWTLMVVEKE